MEKKRNVEYCLLFRTCLVSGASIDYGELYKIGPFNLPSQNREKLSRPHLAVRSEGFK